MLAVLDQVLTRPLPGQIGEAEWTRFTCLRYFRWRDSWGLANHESGSVPSVRFLERLLFRMDSPWHGPSFFFGRSPVVENRLIRDVRM